MTNNIAKIIKNLKIQATVVHCWEKDEIKQNSLLVKSLNEPYYMNNKNYQKEALTNQKSNF